MVVVRRVRVAGLALAGLSLSLGCDNVGGARDGGGGGREPYAHYPALDLAAIPFHAGAGAWGAQRRIEAPALPVTTRSVTVHSAAELAAEGLVPGSEITVGTSFSELCILFGDITDVDVIVPEGITTGPIFIGRAVPGSVTHRLRVRGETAGRHSGGRVGALSFFGDTITDVVIDGLDLNGEDNEGGAGLFYFAGYVERAAVVHVRGHAVGWVALGSGTDLVFAGNNFIADGRPRGVNGFEEGWGIRMQASPVVVFDSRIDGTRYHKVRVHSDPRSTRHYFWASENVFVDPNEGRILTTMHGAQMNGDPYEVWNGGMWATHNTVYAEAGAAGCEDLVSFDPGVSPYGVLTDNTFYGLITARTAEEEAADGADIDRTTGNTYAAWQNPSAWDEPGDPNEIPLPALNPADCHEPDCSCFAGPGACACE